MRKLFFASITAGAWLCASWSCAYDLENKPFDLALTAGMLMPGNIEASWYDDFRPGSTVSFSNNPSLMTRVMADFYLTPHVSLGAALNYGSIIPQADIVYQDHGLHTIKKDDISVLGYCAAVKGRFLLSETVALKPGLYLGAWSSFSSSPEAREIGMAVNGSLELQVFFHENYYFLVDTGFFTQPYGGVIDVAYVRGGPIFYFNLGIGL